MSVEILVSIEKKARCQVIEFVEVLIYENNFYHASTTWVVNLSFTTGVFFLLALRVQTRIDFVDQYDYEK